MNKADSFRSFMLHEIGSTYVLGDEGSGGPEGPDKYDCSGLGYAAFRYAGAPIPRLTANDYYRMGTRIGKPSRVGDFAALLDSTGHAHHIIWYVGTKSGVNVEVEARGRKYGVVLYSVAQSNARGAIWLRFKPQYHADLGALTVAPVATKQPLATASCWQYWNRYKGDIPAIGPKPGSFDAWRSVDGRGNSPFQRFLRFYKL